MSRAHSRPRGQWTTREVLCSFASSELPLVEITPGVATVTPERGDLTMAEVIAARDAQRREVFAYLETLEEADLRRKARILLFAPLIGTDEITLPIFVGAMFDRHGNGRADQLAQIRRAVGLSETQ